MSFSQRGPTAAGTESDEEVMREIGQPMLQMNLGVQHKTRVLTGIVEDTQLLIRGHPLLKMMESGGKDFKQRVQQAREAGDDLSKLAPPHLMKGMKMIDYLADHKNFPDGPLQQDAKDLYSWKLQLEAGEIQEAMSCIRQCWVNPTFDKPGEEQIDRIVFSYEGMILTKLPGALGSVQKCGPPPPMQAERKLAKFFKSQYRAKK